MGVWCMQEPGHALVMGGTGLLRGVCLALVEDGWRVSCIARDPQRLANLEADAARHGGQLLPLSLDYRDEAALAAGIQQGRAALGPIRLVVAWLHGDDSILPQAVVEEVSLALLPWRFFRIRGSAAAAPGAWPRPPEVSHTLCQYREVILGWMSADGGTRWLSDDDITRGILTAIQRDWLESVVGVVRPWANRPD